MVTTAEDNIVRLWDASGRSTSLEFKVPDFISSAEFSPDNRMIFVSAPGKDMTIWNATDGKLLNTLPVGEQITWSSFSADGKRFALGSYRGKVQLWNVESWEPIGPPIQHGLRISQVELSSDGEWMATGSEDHSAQVWEVATGRPVSLPMLHQGEVVRTVFRPDGRLVATGSEDGTARVWEASTGHPMTPSLLHNAPVIRLAFSPNGRSLLTGQRNGSVCV